MPERSVIRLIGLRALLFTATLVVSFGALEIALRLVGRVDKVVTTAVFDVDPERRIAFLPNQTRVYETSELRFTLESNRFGRRGSDPDAAELADPSNVLFVGDSMPFGWGVENDDSLPRRLEAQFEASGRPRRVFNWAIPAAGPPEYRLLLADAFDVGVAARTVLLGISTANDFYVTTETTRKAREEKKTKTVPNRPHRPRSALLEAIQLRMIGSPRLVGWGFKLGNWLGTPLYRSPASYLFLSEQTPEQRAQFARALDDVEQIRLRCEESGRNLRVVVFPNKIQVENRDEMTASGYDPERPNRLILEYCESVGMPCLDLLPVLADAHATERQKIYFTLDRHLTARGNEIAAEALFAFLAANPDSSVTDAPAKPLSKRGVSASPNAG